MYTVPFARFSWKQRREQKRAVGGFKRKRGAEARETKTQETRPKEDSETSWAERVALKTNNLGRLNPAE